VSTDAPKTDAHKAEAEKNAAAVAAAEQRPGSGRFHAVGVPMEKSKDFQATTSRLFERLQPERIGIIAVMVIAVVSVVMVVLGPRILGKATDVVFNGLTGRGGATGIDFGKLHRILLVALALYVASYLLSYLQAYLLAGIVQRTMRTLRNDVESKLNRLPLGYVDRQPRGDLLSRVTNDIDNVAQSLQQSLSQLLTSSLTVIGVDVHHLAVAGHRVGAHDPALRHRDGPDRQAVEAAVHGPVAPHRVAQRAGRGSVHRPCHREGVRPSG
jgi:ATP-binding cassette, subfamily B, multidrug efflux pump